MTNQKNNRNGRRAGLWGLVLVLQSMAFPPAVATAQSPSEYYTEPQIHGDRPNPNCEYRTPQVIGVSGIMARIDKGVTVTVEETQPNTPAAGKFNKNDIIVGVNGVLLKGKHPWVVLGTALTEAEAKDGVLTFDITAGKTGPAKQVTITIPVMGAYSKTFPLNCGKSKQIIKQAAEFYSASDRLKQHNLHNALACLGALQADDHRRSLASDAARNPAADTGLGGGSDCQSISQTQGGAHAIGPGMTLKLGSNPDEG